MSTAISLGPLKDREIRHSRWIERSDMTGKLSCWNTFQSANIQTYYLVRSGWNWDDWETRLAKKQDASTSYSRDFLRLLESRSGVYLGGSGSFFSCGPGQSVQGSWRFKGTPFAGPNVGPSTSDADAAKVAEADMQLRKKYNKRVPDFNAVVPVGEWRETGQLYDRLVNDTYAYVNKAYDLLPYATTLKKFRKVAARAADYWLAYQWGAAPLISDLQTAAADLASKTAGGPGTPSMTVKGESEKSWTTASYHDVWADTNGIMQGKGIVRNEHSCIYRSTLGFEAISPIEDNLELARSVFMPSFGEVVVGIYDLIPYTWLLDYFTTTGEWLEGQFQLMARPFYGTKSRLYTCTSTSSFRPTNGFRTAREAVWVSEYVRYTRTPDTILTTRPLGFKPLDEVYSYKKLLNLVSLFTVKNTISANKEITDFVRNNRSLII